MEQCDNHPERIAAKEFRLWKNEQDPSEQHIVCNRCCDKLVQDALDDKLEFAVENIYGREFSNTSSAMLSQTGPARTVAAKSPEIRDVTFTNCTFSRDGVNVPPPQPPKRLTNVTITDISYNPPRKEHEGPKLGF